MPATETGSIAPAPMSTEMRALKDRLRATWMSGDYGHFARFLEPGALDFLRRLDLQPGERMLDVAGGAGQIAIPAARLGVRVTTVDIAANLVAQARERAAAAGVAMEALEGDAEALPVEDAAFDTVVSLIGAMFAPRPDRVAAELLRACRPGGRIVMANWTPKGMIGQMFRIIGAHVPPSPLMVSPLLWGDPAVVRERLAPGCTSVETTVRTYPFRYPFAPAEVVDFFREWYGPTNRAFAALDDAGRAALHAELTALWTANNLATDGTTYTEAEILEVVAVRG